jgi:tetratricopeptide (TPR) repeat protein
VHAELVGADDNAVLWAETYDRALADVFAVQAEISRAIVVALRPALGGGPPPTGPVRTRDLATYELYLKGRYFLGRRTSGDLRRAVDYFERAVARDSGYAQAYAGLADARVLLVVVAGASPREEQPRARAAAAAALRLDSTLAEAHAALGNIHEAFDWDALGADRELASAVALDPGYATAHLYRGIHLLNRGRFDDAVAELTRARTLDPLSAPVHMQLGRAYVSARRPVEACGRCAPRSS